MSEVIVKTRTLFELSAELSMLEDALSSLDLTEAQQKEAIDIYLQGEAGEELTKKISNYVRLIRECEARAAARKAEAALLSSGAVSIENMAKRLKGALQEFMVVHDKPKIEASPYTVSLQNNGGVIPLILPADLEPTKLPKEFQRVEVTVNAEAVRKALEEEAATRVKNLEAMRLIGADRDADALAEMPLPTTMKYGITLGERGKHIRIK